MAQSTDRAAAERQQRRERREQWARDAATVATTRRMAQSATGGDTGDAATDADDIAAALLLDTVATGEQPNPTRARSAQIDGARSASARRRREATALGLDMPTPDVEECAERSDALRYRPTDAMLAALDIASQHAAPGTVQHCAVAAAILADGPALPTDRDAGGAWVRQNKRGEKVQRQPRERTVGAGPVAPLTDRERTGAALIGALTGRRPTVHTGERTARWQTDTGGAPGPVQQQTETPLPRALDRRRSRSVTRPMSSAWAGDALLLPDAHGVTVRAFWRRWITATLPTGGRGERGRLADALDRSPVLTARHGDAPPVPVLTVSGTGDERRPVRPTLGLLALATVQNGKPAWRRALADHGAGGTVSPTALGRALASLHRDASDAGAAAAGPSDRRTPEPSPVPGGAPALPVRTDRAPLPGRTVRPVQTDGAAPSPVPVRCRCSRCCSDAGAVLLALGLL